MTEITGVIFNFQRFSLHDGPGIRTTIFMKGCPMRCQWCHNPEGQLCEPQLSFQKMKCVQCGRCVHVCRHNVHTIINGQHNIDFSKCVSCGRCADVCMYGALEIVGKRYTVKEAFEEAVQDIDFFDGGGVTLSGGDPMVQYEFSKALAKELNDVNISVCMETEGLCASDKIAAIAPYIDIFLFDIKETDPEKHRLFTGSPLKPVLDNLQLLDKLNAKIILRCPLIPDINTREDHLNHIAEIANNLRNLIRIELEPYHSMGIPKYEQIGRNDYLNLTSNMAYEAVHSWALYLENKVGVPVICS